MYTCIYITFCIWSSRQATFLLESHALILEGSLLGHHHVAPLVLFIGRCMPAMLCSLMSFHAHKGTIYIMQHLHALEGIV